jgi:4-amino-4-deoxy-L-arabinose transferase-like glycosyltransferase
MSDQSSGRACASKYHRGESVALAINENLMLVDREPQASLVRESAGSGYRSTLLSGSAVRGVVVFSLILLIVLALQFASGTYSAEFGGYPDEPAHYITSLMVHDFITSMHWSSPLHFAQQYYHYYPKVAFGHWPPLLYVVQAIWMLLFSISRTSIRIELAVTAAVLGYSVFMEARRWFSGYTAPVLAALLTISIPLVQVYADEEMSETLLALMCFWAVVWFARYLDSGAWRDNLWFGVFFSLAVLTKGNGWLLAGVVPLAVVLTRKFRSILRWQFWVGPALVAVVCLPWQLVTFRMAEQGWTGGTGPSLTYTFSALFEFGVIVMRMAGMVLGCLALLGIAVTIVAPSLRGAVRSAPAAMFAFIVSTWVFHSLVPAGVEDRKMMIAVPAWVLFVFAGGYCLAHQIRLPERIASWRTWLVGGVAGLAFAATAFAIPRQTHYGYAEAAQFITSRPNLRANTMLVSDDAVGEGLLISEIAMRESRPGSRIVRATKALAETNWNGSRYRSLYSTPAQVARAVQDLRIDLVVIGTFHGADALNHNQLLRDALRNQQQFKLSAVSTARPGMGQGRCLSIG